MRDRVFRAADALGDSLDAVRGFLGRRLAPEGGFQGRDGRSDLYYSVFGLEAALALGVDLPHERINAYLDSFGAGNSLDLVHLTSLIRCRANLVEFCGPGAPGRASLGPQTRNDAFGDPVPARLNVSCGDARPTGRLLEHRAQDGGFNTAPGVSRGSAYGSFLALGACQDLGLDLPDMEAVAQSVCSLRMPDGGFSNEPTMAVSATPATAAAICVLHYLKRPVPESAIHWLLDRADPRGGFTAISLAQDHTDPRVEGVPPSNRGRDARDTMAIPDLLSTATALFALSLVGALAAEGKDKHLDYLDSLWNPQGGFRGHWADETVDCEYTYYGLLSLGCLAG